MHLVIFSKLLTAEKGTFWLENGTIEGKRLREEGGTARKRPETFILLNWQLIRKCQVKSRHWVHYSQGKGPYCLKMCAPNPLLMTGFSLK